MFDTNVVVSALIFGRRLMPNLPVTCRDRDDAVFLRLMIASRADLAVSGDSDLAVLAAANPVVSPATLQRHLEQMR